MPVITEETFELIRALGRNAVVTAAETGQLPPGFQDTLSIDELKQQLDDLLDRNKGNLVGLGYDAAFGVLEGLLFPDEPIEKYEERVSQLTSEELAALHGLRAEQAEARKQAIVDGRKALLNDLRATSLVILRGAVASAIAAALGLS